jgi:Skp family chaperone for outer membrane proteins
VKRTFAILAGIAAIGVAIYLSNRLPAQQGGYAQPQTRVALINLSQVFKNYQKFHNFEDQLKADQAWYQKEIDKRKTEMQQIATDATKTADPAARDQMAKRGKALEREIQDYAEDGKTRLSKREFDELVLVYREIQDAVTRYAKAQNIELVMHYNDGIGADVWTPTFFSAKIRNGACQPMYIAPGLDITGVIAEMLNRNMAASQPIQPVNGTGGH